MPDVGDPKAYLTGAMQILSDYPEAVMNIISEPRTGTALLKDYPSLRQLREACDDAYAPIERQLRREAIKAQPKELPRPKRTPEQQARIDAQVAEAKRALASQLQQEV